MRKRYPVLDEIRGITLCSMILYHGVWDLVYIFGMDWEWYRSDLAYIWQQSICWSFILLSGFCFSLGKKKWKRSFTVLCAGAVISLATEIFMPANRIRFGVLTLLGSSMLIVAMAEKLIRIRKSTEENALLRPVRDKSKLWMSVSFMLFLLTRNINTGHLGFADIRIAKMPEGLYHLKDVGNFLGFTTNTFYSTDYFSLFPWFFLFLTGYFFQKWFVEKEWMLCLRELPSMGKVWGVLGRHSLLIYMLHQVVIYGVLYLFFVILP